jgi:hypothetical protein
MCLGINRAIFGQEKEIVTGNVVVQRRRLSGAVSAVVLASSTLQASLPEKQRSHRLMVHGDSDNRLLCRCYGSIAIQAAAVRISGVYEQ